MLDSFVIRGSALGYCQMKGVKRNPLRAKLVKNLDDFEWRSHRGYISRSKDWD